MPADIPSNVINYAEAGRSLKGELSHADDSLLDAVIIDLARFSYGPAAVLEILIDLLGSKRAAKVWCDRADTVGQASWWSAIREQLAKEWGDEVANLGPWRDW